MESVFKQDLSDLRVEESETPKSIGALGLTAGHRLLLAPGQYRPQTAAGRRVLGHEIAHALHHRQGKTRPYQRDQATVLRHPELEADAERWAAKAAGVTPGLESASRESTPATSTRAPTSMSATTAPVLQPLFPLEALWGRDAPGDGEKLSQQTLGELRQMQEFLADEEKVLPHLQGLEERAQAIHGEMTGKKTPNRALNLALQESESWMLPGRTRVGFKEEEGGDSRIDIQQPKTMEDPASKSWTYSKGRPSGSGPMPVPEFTQKALLGRKALKDVGAGQQHGEYTHRLQLHAMHQHAMTPKSEGGLGWTPKQWLHIYRTMASPTLVRDNPFGLHETAKGVPVKQGAHGPESSPVKLSVWDAVMDVRGGWTQGKHAGEERAGLDNYEGVGFAAPVALNEALTDDARVVKGKASENQAEGKFFAGGGVTYGRGRLKGAVPLISEAVTSRRLKRLREAAK